MWKLWRRRRVPEEVVVAADDVASAPLVEAVVMWVGFDREATPKRDDSRLIERFGPDGAARLLSRAKALEDDFYKSNARFAAADLPEMAKLAADDFRELHPGVSEQIVKAFAWCYTYDFK